MKEAKNIQWLLYLVSAGDYVMAWVKKAAMEIERRGQRINLGYVFKVIKMSFLIIWVYGVISTWKEGKMTTKSVT